MANNLHATSSDGPLWGTRLRASASRYLGCNSCHVRQKEKKKKAYFSEKGRGCYAVIAGKFCGHKICSNPRWDFLCLLGVERLSSGAAVSTFRVDVVGSRMSEDGPLSCGRRLTVAFMGS